MSSRPIRMTAVVPMYNVEGYLSEFLDSLGSQRPGPYKLDFVFVDDGSTDGTVAIAEEWADRHPGCARVIRRDHAGVSSARNAGLAVATGDWVTFPDPDDVLDRGYFAAVATSLHAASADEPDILVTNVQRIMDPDPAFTNIHALRFRFARGTRMIALDDEPDVFQMSVASAFFPRSALETSGVRFIEGLHASEDALFVAEYLLSRGSPRILAVAGARYGYRRRAARDSAVDRYLTDPRAYIDRFRDGYLPLLTSAAKAGGVPSWLQSMLLYECQWLLPVQLTVAGYAASLDDESRAEALDALTRCLEHVSEDRLLRYDATALPLESRLLILALTGRPLWDWVGYYVDRTPRPDRSIVVHGYAVVGEGPALSRTRATRRGVDTPITGERLTAPDYFGQTRLLRHSLRVVGQPDTIYRAGTPLQVFWPRPGESATQAADRHRRQVIGDRSRAIPPPSGAVRVWKYARSSPREVLRIFAAHRRRDLATAITVITHHAPRPRAGWLVEHAPDDPDQLSRALFEHLTAHGMERPVRLVAARGRYRDAPRRAVRRVSLAAGRWGSRARYRVLDLDGGSPVDGAWRIIVHSGAIGTAVARRIEAITPDVVIVSTEADAAELRARTSLFEDEVIVIPRERTIVDLEMRVLDVLNRRASTR